jgi:ubiquinone/menaquinone biosynthesis C-methylase UbiE
LLQHYSDAQKIKKIYSDMAAGYDDLVFKEKDYIAFEKIPEWDCSKRLPSSANIELLDLGCGTG